MQCLASWSAMLWQIRQLAAPCLPAKSHMLSALGNRRHHQDHHHRDHLPHKIRKPYDEWGCKVAPLSTVTYQLLLRSLILWPFAHQLTLCTLCNLHSTHWIGCPPPPSIFPPITIHSQATVQYPPDVGSTHLADLHRSDINMMASVDMMMFMVVPMSMVALDGDHWTWIRVTGLTRLCFCSIQFNIQLEMITLWYTRQIWWSVVISSWAVCADSDDNW